MSLDTRSEREAIDKKEGLWGDPSSPKTGWEYVGIRDLGEPTGKCEACGTLIRFVQTLYHPEAVGYVDAGCVCAGRLTGDPETAARRDRDMQTKARKAAERKKAEDTQREAEEKAALELLWVDALEETPANAARRRLAAEQELERLRSSAGTALVWVLTAEGCWYCPAPWSAKMPDLWNRKYREALVYKAGGVWMARVVTVRGAMKYPLFRATDSRSVREYMEQGYFRKNSSASAQSNPQ